MILFMIMQGGAYEIALDLIESGELTDYYRRSRILKFLDEICYASFVRFLGWIKHASIHIDDVLVSARGKLSYAGFTKPSNLLQLL